MWVESKTDRAKKEAKVVREAGFCSRRGEIEDRERSLPLNLQVERHLHLKVPAKFGLPPDADARPGLHFR